MRWRLTALVLVLASASGAGAAASRRGMVASEHRLASEAGVAVLRRGGNAVDAAVAAALAVCVLNPSSCGIGGGGFMLVYERRTRTVHALDFRESAPAAATQDMFLRDGRPVPELSRRGGLAVAVPGEVAGLDAAQRRFGRLSWAAVAEPAIGYAREGFPVGPHTARAIEAAAERIRSQPELAAVLLRPDGASPAEGERLRLPDLAGTLERIAAEGPSAFYGGAVARAIAESAAASGGILTLDDLAGYRPVWRTPLRGGFRGFDVYGMPPPSSGGGVLLEILGILGGDDLPRLGRRSAAYLHLLAEAMQFGFADRAAHYGDPGFADVPVGRLLSPRRLRDLRNRITRGRTHSPEFYGRMSTTDDHGTAHLSVVDGEGNAVACTTSINGAFGSFVVARGTGIILNNTMDDFSQQPGAANAYGLIGSRANAVAGRKRPLSSMAPTIVLRNGRATAVAGGSGGPFILSATAQALLNALVFGRNAAASVGAPRIHHQWTPSVLNVEPGLADRRAELERLGHRTAEAGSLGAVQLVRRGRDGRLDGAADPRKGGEAVGW